MPDLKSFYDFMENINRKFDKERFYFKNDYIYYLPYDVKVDESIHYIRTGLLMGRLRNGRFEPSQALAMNLKEGEWKNPLSLKLEDPRVLRYLKAETIEADDEAEGYRLVCVNGHSLGWVKQSKTKCKNKYYPGWRYN